MNNRTLAPIAGMALLASVLAGCASDDTAGSGTDVSGSSTTAFKDCTNTQIPKSTDNPYFAAVQAGMIEAQGEIGGKLEYVGPAAGDVTGQIQRIQSAGQQGACAIGIAALDATAVAPALDAAAKQGAKILTWDADVSVASRCLFINMATAQDLGVSQFSILADQLNNQGKFAIISSQSNAESKNLWIKAMEAELEKPEYAGMELVKTTYGDDDSKKSYDLAVSLIRAYPDLAGIMAPTPIALEASAKAVKDLGVEDQIVVTGLGNPGSDAQLLIDGDVPAYVLWSPKDLGYLSYYATKALVDGEVGCDEGETFEAGRLGTMTVGVDGEVIMGQPIIFTADNVNDYLDDFAGPE